MKPHGKPPKNLDEHLKNREIIKILTKIRNIRPSIRQTLIIIVIGSVIFSKYVSKLPTSAIIKIIK